MDADLFNPIFTDENKAREWLEARVWADGRACPHCGVFDQSTLMHRSAPSRPLSVQRLPRTFHGHPLARSMRLQMPLHNWLAATRLIMASKNAMSNLVT